jgi:hypothetical protein
MKKMILLLTVCTLASFSFAWAPDPISGLTLHIDTSANELWFSGSDMGMPFFQTNTQIWSDSYGTASGVSFDVSPAIAGLGLGSVSLEFAEGLSDITVVGYFGGFETTTIASTGTHINYTSLLSASDLAIFESEVSTITSLDNYVETGFGFSNGFSSMTVEIVPEPATMAILGLGGLFIRRRRA